MTRPLIIALLSLLFLQCGESKDPYSIETGRVGLIDRDVRIGQIDSIFAQDSVVGLSPTTAALGTVGEVEIYEKGGSKLLLVSPEDDRDPNARITNIQVFDSRYLTDKGLSTASTFADVKANYAIASIENAINSVVVFLADSDIYLTIDKKELPEELRYNYNARIEATQIPDEATIKYFMIGWDHSKDDNSTDQ